MIAPIGNLSNGSPFPGEFFDMFRIGQENKNTLLGKVAEYEIHNRRAAFSNAALEALDSAISAVEAVKFFSWFDRLIRSSNSSTQRKQNEEEFLSLFGQHPEIQRRIQIRAHHPDPVSDEMPESEYLLQDDLPFHSLIYKEILSSGFSRDEIVKVFSFLDRLILTSNSSNKRLENRRMLIEALEMLDKKAGLLLKEKNVFDLYEMEMKISGISRALNENKRDDALIAEIVANYPLDELDVQQARDNIDARFAFIVTQHKDYPISQLDREIADENPESWFTKGLERHPRFKEPALAF